MGAISLCLGGIDPKAGAQPLTEDAHLSRKLRECIELMIGKFLWQIA